MSSARDVRWPARDRSFRSLEDGHSLAVTVPRGIVIRWLASASRLRSLSRLQLCIQVRGGETDSEC